MSITEDEDTMSTEASSLLTEATSPPKKVMLPLVSVKPGAAATTTGVVLPAKPQRLASNAPEVDEGEDGEADLLEMAEDARDAGLLDDAHELYCQLLAARRVRLGSTHAETIAIMDKLGAIIFLLGDPKGASELLLEALAARRATLGEEHHNTIASVANSGMMLKETGDLAAAEPLLRQALTAMEALHEQGSGGRLMESTHSLHTELLICRANLGSLLHLRGDDLDGAEALLRDATDGMYDSLGESAPPTLHACVQLGSLLLDKGSLDEAEMTLREALAV